MSRLLLALVTGSLLFVFSLSYMPAHAQEWEQEMQVLTTVEYGSPMYVFLDSLAVRLDKNPTFPIRRSVDDAALMPYSTLLPTLHEEGVDLRSASHVFLRYRFAHAPQGSGIIETLDDLYFIFRLDESTSDLPIVHIDTKSEVVSTLLLDRGVSSVMNIKSVQSFRKLMSFPLLYNQQETAIVEVGHTSLREDLQPHHQQLIDYLNAERGVYMLKTLY